jgi:hypothetical protein
MLTTAEALIIAPMTTFVMAIATTASSVKEAPTTVAPSMTLNADTSLTTGTSARPATILMTTSTTAVPPQLTATVVAPVPEALLAEELEIRPVLELCATAACMSATWRTMSSGRT